MICFLVLNFSLYFFNSVFIILKSSTGFLPSDPDASITCNNNLVLSICLKNLSPSPVPSLAPSIIPGISAITKLSPKSVFTTPKFGSNVVKWYSAILGLADVTTDNIVDFPYARKTY